jgi:hypothetical protein
MVRVSKILSFRITILVPSLHIPVTRSIDTLENPPRHHVRSIGCTFNIE